MTRSLTAKSAFVLVASLLALTTANAGPAIPPEVMIIQTHDRKPDLEGLDAETCFPVREVRISGVELIDQQALRTQLQPFVYRCMGNGVARAIVGAINEAHVDKGFATTQGYLPDQDIRNSDALIINVISGRIDKVIYQEEARDAGAGWADRITSTWQPVREANGAWSLINGLSDLLDTADDQLDRFQIIDGARWPTVKRWGATELGSGDVVNVDDIQEAVDTLNTVPSNRVEAKLTPGDEPATSNIILINKRGDSFRMVAGYEVNGAGLDQSGRTISKRLRLDTAKDNLIGINDSWSTSFASGLDSNEARGRVSIPWRRFNFALDGAYTEQVTAITRNTEMFYQSGNVAGSVSYLLERSRARQTVIDSSLAWRQIERDINARRLTPQRVSIARVGLARTHFFEKSPLNQLFGETFLGGRLLGSQLSWGTGINRGLTIWDATRDGPQPDRFMPRAQFWKIDGRAGVAQGLRDLGVLRIDIVGQWTNHPLYADDQQTIGSVSTVRGFTNLVARVDRGFVVRTEFAPALPVDAMLTEADRLEWPFLNDMLRAIQPYAFYDFGHGRDIASEVDLTRTSLGAGLRFSYGRTNLDVSVAHPVTDIGKEYARKGPEIYFTINTKLL